MHNFIFAFFSFIALTLGNASIKGVDVTIFITFICLLMLQKVYIQQKFKLNSIYLGLAIFSILVLMVFQGFDLGIPYIDYYFLWTVKTLLLIAVFRHNVKFDAIYFLPPLLVVNMLIYLTSSIEAGRLVSIFGPNMIYRFSISLFIVTILLLRDCKDIRIKLLYLGILILSLSITVQSGSVGGVLSLFIFALIHYTKVTLISVFVFVSVVFVNYEYFTNINIGLLWRIFHKFDTFQTSARFENIIYVLHNIPILGKDYNYYSRLLYDEGHMYPHNFIIELLAYFGLIGVLLSVAVVVGVFNGINCKIPLYFILLPFFVGSVVSGDLSDNYVTIVAGITGVFIFHTSKVLNKT